MSRHANIIELRRRYTGETHQQAKEAVSRIRADGYIDWWPAATASDQVVLEARIFRILSSAETNFGFGPLMLTGVTPWPDCLVMHIRPDALAAVLGALLPWSLPDIATGTANDLWGVPGLRAHGRRDSITLYRPGATGRILIPIPLGVASLLLDGLPNPFEVDAAPLWQHSPSLVTPAEAFWEREIADSDGTVDWILSGLFRRAGLIVASSTPTCWVDCWINPGDLGPEVQWEWCHGTSGAAMARRLLTGPCSLPMFTDGRGRESMVSSEQRRIRLYAADPVATGVLALRPNTLKSPLWARKPLNRIDPRQQALDSLRHASFGAESIHHEFGRHRLPSDGAEK